MLPLDQVLDLLAVGVIVHDADTRILYSNGRAERVLGLAEQEMRNRDTFDPRWALVHPDGTPVEPEDIPVVKAIRTGQPVVGAVVGVLAADGERAWLLVDANPVLAESGEVRRVVVSFSDITAELTLRHGLEAQHASLGEAVRRTDEQLSEARRALMLSEAEYHSVLRAMAEGVAVHAPDGSILYANPAAESILGLTLEQMHGRHPVDPAWQLTDAGGIPLSPDAIPSEITRKTGQPQRNVVLGIHRDAVTRGWLSVSTDPIAMDSVEEGRPAVVATFTDITAEREALAEARRARDHLRDIASALPGVVMEYLLQPDGRDQFLYISEPVRDYFGIEPAEILRDSASAWQRLHPDDAVALQDSVRRAAESGASILAEFRLKHVDGEYRFVRLRSGAPVRTPEGVLFRSVLLDVTEQRRLEETVRESQRREAMGTLAAGIAHNFNNLLATILPNLEMARAAAPAGVMAELDDAFRATTAASELVRQLMQLVRRDETTRPEPIDAAALARDVARMCRGTFDRRIDIVCETPDTACMVVARRAELQQVLLNLAINARDALAERPAPKMSLSVYVEGEAVLVTVADNGVGMSPEVQARLGQPFFTTKAPGHGTGLGVASVFGILRDIGATLTVKSEADVGSTFEIRLPRQIGTTPAPRRSVETGAVDAFGLRLLVIDDEPLVRTSLERMLDRMGCQAIVASSGPEGLLVLENDPDVDGVFLDLSMPGMGGAAVLRRIRQMGLTVPVYIISGFIPDDADVKGATGLLAKPFQMSQLRTVCEAIRDR